MAEAKVRVVIVGGSGYTGLELLRLLIPHPRVEVVGVTSRQYQGKKVQQVFPSLGPSELIFINPAIEELVDEGEAVFTAVPHREAMEIVAGLQGKKELRIIDLSADFRLRQAETYQDWYGPHQAPELLAEAVYGLPEIYFSRIQQARLIGNPGCYPTSVILGLAPLLKAGAVQADGMVIDSKSGVSGAGRSLALGSLYCEVAEGFKAYKVGGEHRHIPEIEQELSLLAGRPLRVTFTPHLVPMSRGILSTMVLSPEKELTWKGVRDLFEDFYREAPFIRLVGEDDLPNTLRVRGSNYCEIGWRLDRRTGRLIVLSAIDNLVKGAAGQAIQNLNILLGWDQTLGLTQLPLYP
ncbi:MAG: N-acetyl-gamma-glutamyl-phosphate reductase [Deltaproteobacteria bacterium]|nr:N-acetyl-gamma-glutamyl-phosphate reductase [Deltaproteobacteria bacterium]